MIHSEKPSLSVCAFGAGAAHAAVLALVLPVMITLPAPNDTAQGTVAIQVAVRTAPHSPFVKAAAGEAFLPEGALAGEGDVDDTAWSEPVLQGEPQPQEVTGAVPEILEQPSPAEPVEQAALAAPIEAAAPVEAVEPAALPDAALMESVPVPESVEDVELSTVASVESADAAEPDEALSIVPLPLRKPALAYAAPRPKGPDEPKPALRKRVSAARPSARSTAAKPFKGILGGTQATPMPEFPFQAGR